MRFMFTFSFGMFSFLSGTAGLLQLVNLTHFYQKTKRGKKRENKREK